MGARHLAVRQTHERAVVQPGGGQFQAHQAHAQALGGGVANQANVIKARAFGGFGPVQVMRGKPGAPRLQGAAQQDGIA